MESNLIEGRLNILKGEGMAFKEKKEDTTLPSQKFWSQSKSINTQSKS
jgi:hypothetical protein